MWNLEVSPVYPVSSDYFVENSLQKISGYSLQDKAQIDNCKVAVPLMKMSHHRADFLYAFMAKGYLNSDIDAYVDMIGRKSIIDQRAHRSIEPLTMEKPEAARYKAKIIVERTNSCER